MKRITPIILTAFSAVALSFSTASFADNTDSDGFIVFESVVTEAAPAAAPPKAKKRVAKKSKRKVRKKSKKRAKRVVRKKRSTRTTRVKRGSSLRTASSYKVRKGDTLYRISVNSGVKLSRLMSLNKLRGSKKHNIQAGQRIRLR